jgi:ADP-heptose:LPS heptosyltransferase
MSEVKKILIVRFSSIGDIVLTTPVVRCVQVQTGATVDFLCKNNFKSVVEENPSIRKVFTINKSYVEVIEQLKSEEYDLLLDLQHNLHSWKLKRALGVPSHSFPKLNVEKWLMVNMKINVLPAVHIVDRYMSTAIALGVKNDGNGLDYFIPSGQEISPETYLPGSSPFVAFVTGAAHFTKRLPEEKIVQICSRIAHPVVLLGGKEEAASGDRIAAAAGVHVFNACGKFNLHQSASWVRQSAMVISHDTGLMHIAAAFKKKIITIWGNTVPEFGMFPYYPKGEDRHFSVQVSGISCRPCSKIGYEKCPKGHFKCMKEQDVNLIAGKVSEWMSGA